MSTIAETPQRVPASDRDCYPTFRQRRRCSRQLINLLSSRRR